jgi:glycosyltransferase involved in cell wall biosynthesis
VRVPVRLLVVNPSPVHGGAEEMLLSLITRGNPARVAPVVACLADGDFPDELERAGARVVRVPAGRLRNAAAWARAVGRLRALARDSDAVLSWQVKGHYYGTPAARLARRPAAWWDHGIRPTRGESRYLIDHLLPSSLRADLVVCSSSFAASRHRRAIAIHPGVSLESYGRVSRRDSRARLGLGEDEPVVGIVGRLQRWKRQHELLRAAPAVLERYPNVRFLVVGGALGGFDADYPAELVSLARSLGIAGQVGFLGHRDDVPAILPALDLFVHASEAEPFGIVIVEAMATGLPVVASRGGGVAEILADDETGLLTSGAAPEIAAGVIRLLDDPALAARIGAAARDRAQQRFSVERFVREVEELALRLAGRSS